MSEDKKNTHGGKRAGAGRKKNEEGEGKSLYFRFRCSQRIYDIIHQHEEEGMSAWIERAILEKHKRDSY